MEELDRLRFDGHSVLIIRHAIIELAPRREGTDPLVIGNLASRLLIGTGDLLSAAVPLLKSGNPAVRELAENLLTAMLRYGRPGFDDLDLRDYIETYETGSDTPLANLMMAYAPDLGFRVMSQVFLTPDAQREMDWIGHLVVGVAWREEYGFGDRLAADRAAAIEQLHHLAARPEWWARYFVAATILRCPSLADPEMVEKLKADPDPRVRAVMHQSPGNQRGSASSPG